MTHNTREEEVLAEFDERFVTALSTEYKTRIREWVKYTLHQELQKALLEKDKECGQAMQDFMAMCHTAADAKLQKAREEEVSNIIADYMEALGTVVLPEEVWLWIADINGKYLNKSLKENI